MVFVVFVVLACRIFGKPALQATLRIFGLCGSCVVLVWFLCGSFCGFWIDCGFWLWSARPIALCGFCGSVVLPSMPTVARPIVLMWFLWLGGLAQIDARPLALCGLLKRFAHRPDS